MIDGMTNGFIIPLAGDIHIRTNEDASLIDITENPYVKLTEEHSKEQVGPAFPFPGKHLVKFLNHFVIKTPPGYSCLFVAPINHLETRFLTLGAVVDTDIYDREINFPSVWLANNFDEILPAGTPIIQCIPFKRENTISKFSVRPFDIHTTTISFVFQKLEEEKKIHTYVVCCLDRFNGSKHIGG
jgi:hypothetical protein